MMIGRAAGPWRVGILKRLATIDSAAHTVPEGIHTTTMELNAESIIECMNYAIENV